MNAHEVAISPPSLPKGGGAIQSIGTGWGAVGATGVASVGIPLPISPGRGFAPTLGLAYNSQDGRSEFGQGWSLSLPAVTVQTGKGVPRYGRDAHGQAIEQEYTSPGGDVLLPERDSAGIPIVRSTRAFRDVDLGIEYDVIRYFPRVAGGGECYERWAKRSAGTDVFWLIHGPDGTVHLYGKSARTEHALTDGRPPSIAEWLLEESVAANGEHVCYEYVAEDGAGLDDNDGLGTGWQGRDRQCRRYLQRVRYGNHAPATEEGVLVPFLMRARPGLHQWHFDLVFDYGARDVDLAATPGYDIPAQTHWPLRADPVSHYRYGFEVRTLRLCHQVLMFHTFPDLGTEPVLVRRLLLEYDAQPTVTQLVAAHVVGYATDGPEHAPPVEFDYAHFALPASGQSAPFKPFVPFDPRPAGAGSRLPAFSGGDGYQMVDLYGEGMPGVLSRGAGGWWYRRPIRDTGPDSGPDDVAYSPWQRLDQVPTANLRVPVRQVLSDLSGDGRLEWIVAQPGMTGFFSLDPSRAWERFTPYAAFPPEFFHPQAQLADLVGAGLSDVVLIGTRSVRLYGNLRANDDDPARRGFEAPVNVLHEGDGELPVLGDGRQEIVAFSDILGSGQQHLVRIRHDEISCFPNLGRGRFGSRIKLADLPFSRDAFNPAHVRLADLDGSGAVDVLYFQGRTVQVFMNLSGHGFAPAVTLRLPEDMSCDALSEISVADLQGLGCASLVVTVPRHVQDGHDGLQPVHWRCDFVSGVKPYLLCRTDNNMGAEGSVTYRSSAQEWLDEKQEQADPTLAVCRLPFPVHVVTRQARLDRITGSCYAQAFRYRGGYYDGVEREFRGFARVWQDDTDVPADGASPDDGFTAPVQTRTWFHVGATLDPDRAGTYVGDPYAQNHPLGVTLRSTAVSVLGADTLVPRWDDDAALDAGTESDARRALGGMVWRTEVWRVPLPGDAAPTTPYSASETRYLLRRLSPRTSAQRYARLLPLAVEQRQFTYDQCQDDPLCQHTVGLCWDRHGSPLQTVVVAYARRVDARPPFVDDGSEDYIHFVKWWGDAHDKAQESYYLGESLSKVLHLDDPSKPDHWRLHLPCRTRGNALVLERGEVEPMDLGYEALRSETSLLAKYADRVVLTGQGCVRYADCDDDTVDFKALPAYSETAELDEEALRAYIPPGETVSKLGATPAEIVAKLQEVGYVAVGHWDPVQGTHPIPSPPALWAARRGFTTYAGLTGFYRPLTQKPVHAAGETTVDYDMDYCVTRAVTAPDGCKTKVVKTDFRILAAVRIDDANENSQEARYDGFGRLLASTFWGTEPEIDADGIAGPPRNVGFAAIDAFEHTYMSPGEAIADPENALQDVAEAFFYDAFSAMRVESALAARVPAALAAQILWTVPGEGAHLLRATIRWRLHDPSAFPGLPDDVRLLLAAAPGQPVHGATLQADRYPGDPERQIRIAVSASDGLGRVLQVKQKVPPGDAYVVEDGELALDASGQPRREATSTRWRVSERVEYNNKGLAVRVYRPYFANTHAHIRDESFRQFGYCDRQYYDPLGRPARTLTPREERVDAASGGRRRARAADEWVVKWYMKRWTYHPWYVVAEDENDTASEMLQP
ncbi:SpvB/TcaC N-terminal domain-containing protein [Luteibacter yeojuensis]